MWNLQDSNFNSNGELVVNSHSSTYNGIALLDVPIDLSDFSSIDYNFVASGDQTNVYIFLEISQDKSTWTQLDFTQSPTKASQSYEKNISLSSYSGQYYFRINVRAGDGHSTTQTLKLNY